MTGMKTLKEKNQLIATVLAFAVIPMSGLATDIYLPSMPSMATELHQPESNIQLTLSIFLISYGLTQFFAGSIVDSFGRYRVSMASLALFCSLFFNYSDHSEYFRDLCHEGFAGNFIRICCRFKKGIFCRCI